GSRSLRTWPPGTNAASSRGRTFTFTSLCTRVRGVLLSSWWGLRLADLKLLTVDLLAIGEDDKIVPAGMGDRQGRHRHVYVHLDCPAGELDCRPPRACQDEVLEEVVDLDGDGVTANAIGHLEERRKWGRRPGNAGMKKVSNVPMRLTLPVRAS